MRHKAIAVVRRGSVNQDLQWALQWALWGSLLGFAIGLANRLLGY